ncbi:MAG: PQQ-binding-like beta-propeller repeat protein, partial [Planctomycetota bacterium]
MHAADKRRRLSASHLLLVVLALVFGHAAPLQARQASPVYVDDSPSAAEGISRARELASVGNWDEAVRVLQALLDEQAEFVVPDRADEDLFVPTRSAVHTALWANTRLLERYAELEGPRADAMLRTGAAREVERTRLMTPAGFEATMQVAQHRLEDAAFAGAWLTLMQLDSHPQRTGERASAAAQLLEQVASYMAIRDETYAEQRWRIVDRWRTEANLQPLKDRRRPSAPDVRSGRTPFQVGPQVDLDGIVSKPLASRRMGEPIDGVRRLQNEETRRSIPELARVLHAVPMLADDVVYVNDSETISAWDRFTLTRKWRTSIIGTIEGGGGVTGRIGVEDVNSVVFADPYIVTLTGLSVRSQNARERALCALDPNTGVLIWRTSISEMGEPALDGADLRGPAIVDQDTVILAAIREVTRQRLLSVSLVGFDLATGQLKWHRSLGSIGFVPWALVPEAADAPLTSEGVTYRADRIGIIAAVESATGRLKWIRRMPRDFDHRAERPGPWGGNQPVRHGDHLFLLSPGRDRVLMLDAATGRIERQVNAGRFERPNYLLVAGGLLIGVGNDTITAVPLDALRDRRPQIIATFPGVGIRGRVLLAGDRLLVPTVEGVRVVAPELRPEDVPEVPEHPLITLDAPGNIVASQGQIIAVDDTRLHTYLSWEIAEALLRDRMDQDARRAAPAITYAELSFRAGRHERIVEAVDHALRAIERDPLAPESERDQHRLFDALLGMIEPAPDTPLGPDVSDDLRESLIDRMARVAIEPDQQVAYLMVSGDFYESIGQGPRAVERYQEVLASPVLAPIVFRSGATTLPAEAAATRRLRRLVRIDGPTVYAAYDAEARRALAQLGSSGSAADFERVARQYPVANSTPRAWVEAAERHSDDGRPQLAIFCLEEGLTAAGALTGTPEVEFGELAGRLLTVMLDNDRPVRARQRLARLEADAPELMLTVEGRPIDVESLRASIDDRLSQLRRRPR